MLVVLLAGCAERPETRTFDLGSGVFLAVPVAPKGWRLGTVGHSTVEYRTEDRTASVEIYVARGEAESSGTFEQRAQAELTRLGGKAQLVGPVAVGGRQGVSFVVDGSTRAVVTEAGGSLVVVRGSSSAMFDRVVAEMRFADGMPAPPTRLPWGTVVAVVLVAGATAVATRLGAHNGWMSVSASARGTPRASAAASAFLWALSFVCFGLTPLAAVVVGFFFSGGAGAVGTLVFMAILVCFAVFARLFPMGIAAGLGGALGAWVGGANGQAAAARMAFWLAFAFGVAELVMAGLGGFLAGTNVPLLR